MYVCMWKVSTSISIVTPSHTQTNIHVSVPPEKNRFCVPMHFWKVSTSISTVTPSYIQTNICVQPVPGRWDSKWSSEYKTKPSMVKVEVSFQTSRLKRNLWWPSRISFVFWWPFRVSSSRQRAVSREKNHFCIPMHFRNFFTSSWIGIPLHIHTRNIFVYVHTRIGIRICTYHAKRTIYVGYPYIYILVTEPRENDYFCAPTHCRQVSTWISIFVYVHTRIGITRKELFMCSYLLRKVSTFTPWVIPLDIHTTYTYQYHTEKPISVCLCTWERLLLPSP